MPRGKVQPPGRVLQAGLRIARPQAEIGKKLAQLRAVFLRRSLLHNGSSVQQQ